MRTTPPRTTEQQQAAERDIALRTGTPSALRSWAQTYDVPLLGMDDDELLLISIHEVRAELFPTLRRASQEWLKTNKARILAERQTKPIPATRAMAGDAPDHAAQAIADAMKESL